MRALIAEDNDLMQKIGGEAVEKLADEKIFCQTHEEVRNACALYPELGVMLIDIRLLNGGKEKIRETLTIARRMHPFAVIIVWSASSDYSESELIQAGADKFISRWDIRGISIDKLYEMIVEAIVKRMEDGGDPTRALERLVSAKTKMKN